MLIGISTLRSATGDFAEINKLGEGGFGAVYKVHTKQLYISWGKHITIFIARLNFGSILHRVLCRTAKK
jgi:hypothetical protein